MDFDFDAISHTYTDDSGETFLGYVNDTREGKNGFTGFVYLKDGKGVFEFVESSSVKRL